MMTGGVICIGIRAIRIAIAATLTRTLRPLITDRRRKRCVAKTVDARDEHDNRRQRTDVAMASAMHGCEDTKAVHACQSAFSIAVVGAPP